MKTVTNSRVAHRRRILVKLGLASAKEAEFIARDALRWSAKLREHGHDPEAYGDLGTRRVGGRPRCHTEATHARTARYHDLRRRGWRCWEANRGASTESTYAYALRRIALGLPYR